MTLLELVNRAIDIASKNADTSVNRLALEVAAEPLVPLVFHEVSAEIARVERKRTLLRRTKTLAFVSGAVVLSSDVLTEYIRDGSIIDSTDKTKRYSWTPWNQFTSDELDPRLGHFAVEGETTMHVVEPGTAYNPSSGPTVSLRLTVPCVVEVPTLSTNPVVAVDEIIDDLVKGLAAALVS